MTRPRRRLPALFAAIALVAGLTSLVAVQPATAVYGHVVVAKQLNNPRHLQLVGSTLFIAEAGRGGSACEGTGEDQFCAGATGAVSRVRNAASAVRVQPYRIVKGLLSAAGPDGSFALGATGVAYRNGRFYSVVNGGPPEFPGSAPARHRAALLRTVPDGIPQVWRSLGGYERRHDPDNQGVESNPYDVIALPDGDLLAADAAGNSIIRIDPAGNLSTYAVLPTIVTGECGEPRDTNGDEVINAEDKNEDGRWSCDFVPTALALGPGGAVYVAGLASDMPGEGRVVRLDPVTHRITRSWRGFTGAVGVAVAPDGALYVSQLFAGADSGIPGLLTRVGGGERVSRRVPFPGGVVVDAQGRIFVAAWSIAPSTGLGRPGSTGQVWRFPRAAFTG